MGKRIVAVVLFVVLLAAAVSVQAGPIEAQAIRAARAQDSPELTAAQEDIQTAEKWIKTSYFMAFIAGGVAIMGASHADPLTHPERRKSFDEATGYIGLAAGVTWLTGHVKRWRAKGRVVELSASVTPSARISVVLAW